MKSFEQHVPYHLELSELQTFAIPLGNFEKERPFQLVLKQFGTLVTSDSSFGIEHLRSSTKGVSLQLESLVVA